MGFTLQLDERHEVTVSRLTKCLLRVRLIWLSTKTLVNTRAVR